MSTNFSYLRIEFWIFFLILFSSAFTFFNKPFEFYFYYLIVLFILPFLLIKYGFPKFLFQLIILPLLIGFIHVLLGNNLSFTFIKILGGLFALILFFYNFISHYKFDFFLIFTWYCKATYILCIIAMVQIISFYFDFNFGYDYRWFLNKWGFIEGGIIGIRVNSILPEPTYLATVLAPSVFISIRNLIYSENLIFKKYESLLVLSISILTTSSIGYLGILISLLILTKTIKLRYLVIGAIISFFAINLAYQNVPDFKSRLDAAKGLWFEEDFNIKNTNNSSFVLYNNLHIAKENLIKFPLFGTGLGSHETAFKKFTLTNSLIQYDFEFNIKDGNSLFVRLCTETGLIGLLFIILIIINGFIYKVDSNNPVMIEHKLISQSIFVLLVLVLIRQGNYMLNGLPLMFLLYYFNGIQYKEKLISSEQL